MSASPEEQVVGAAVEWLKHFETSLVAVEDLDAAPRALVNATRALTGSHDPSAPIVAAALAWLTDFEASGLVVADLDPTSRKLAEAVRHLRSSRHAV